MCFMFVVYVLCVFNRGDMTHFVLYVQNMSGVGVMHRWCVCHLYVVCGICAICVVFVCFICDVCHIH